MGHTKHFTDLGIARFYELAASGQNSISVRAPVALSVDSNFVLPPGPGVAGYVLGNPAGDGVTDWVPPVGGSDFATLTILNQGKILFRELLGNGTAAVEMRAAASMAASYVLTLPDAPPVGTQFLQFDSAGNASFSSGSATLQGAYTSGEDIALAAGKVIDLTQANNEAMLTLVKSGVGAGRLVTITDAGTGGCLSLVQTGNAVALTVVKSAGAANILDISATGAFSGSAVKVTLPSAGSGVGADILNDGSGIALKVTQQTTTATAAQINQARASFALDINRTSTASASNAAVDISDSCIGSSSVLNVSKVAGSLGPVATFNQDNADAGLIVTQNTVGKGIYVNRTINALATLAALDIHDVADGPCLSITKEANGGSSINVDHANSNVAVYIKQTAAGRAARFEHSNAGGGNCVEIENNGSSVGLNILQTINGVPLYITRNAFSASVAALHIEDGANANIGTSLQINRTSSGPTGSCFVIVDSGNGPTWHINHAHTGSTSAAKLFNAGTGLTIATDSGGVMESTGAKLTKAGVWTAGTCLAETKEVIDPIQPTKEDEWLSNLDKLRLVRWTAKAAPEDSPVLGALQDELVQYFGFDPNRGVAGGEVGAVALVCLRALHKVVQGIDARLLALEVVKL